MQATETFNTDQVAPMVDEDEEEEAAVLEDESGSTSEIQSRTVSPDLKKLTAPALQGLRRPGAEMQGILTPQQKEEGRE